MIYLDNAATTWPKSEGVYRAMDQAARELAFNAGRGGYPAAARAAAVIDETRELMKALFGVGDGWQTVFTPSATIALNQILKGFDWREGDVVCATPYEHNSVARVLYYLEKTKGIRIVLAPLREDCTIDLDELAFLMERDKPKLMVSTVISNVTGYILPVDEMSRLAKEADAAVVLDASQAAGLLPICKVVADYIVWAGHKTLYGPFGVGGYVASDVALESLSSPYIHGGTGSDSLNLDMPPDGTGRYEAGSENVVAIAGLREALLELAEQGGWKRSEDVLSDRNELSVCMQRGADHYLQHDRELRDKLLRELSEIDGIRIFPPEDQQDTDNYAGILSFASDRMDPDDMGDILAEDYDIAVRTGYHCAPWIHEYIGSRDSGGTVRVSVGRGSGDDDIRVIKRAIDELDC